jgi:hypothetical protein
VIEVRTSAGDRAYADDPEHAIYVARTLLADAREAARPLRINPTATFLVDDVVVRAGVRSQAL